MDISTAVKTLLHVSGMKQYELGKYFKMNTQSFSNKVREQRWSASDLVKVAEVTGCKLAFILPDGQPLILSGTPGGDVKPAPEGGKS